MTLSTLVTIIGGVVTAACAIAGAIAGIRARKAQEARNEEYNKAQHNVRMSSINSSVQNQVPATINYNTQPTQPVSYVNPEPRVIREEVHHYYHGPDICESRANDNMPPRNQDRYANESAYDRYVRYYQNGNNRHYNEYQPEISYPYNDRHTYSFENPDANYSYNYNNNNNYNNYNCCTYRERETYPYEREIGNISKMEMMASRNNGYGYNNYNNNYSCSSYSRKPAPTISLDYLYSII